MESESKHLLNTKKIRGKQHKARDRILRDMNIKSCDNPTQFLMICNAGLATGLQGATLQQVLNPLIKEYEIVMPTEKSYSFIKCSTVENAIVVYENIHGKVKTGNATLCCIYVESVPSQDKDLFSCVLPPGLSLIENFITKEEECFLLKTIDDSWNESTSTDLRHRKVKHFGYEFEYGTNTVNLKKPIAPIPKDYEFLQVLFEKHGCGQYKYDQLTINQYLPGQGIPAHIDTHGIFEDTILSLSLNSAAVMDFKRENRKLSVCLPPRSLLIMSEESRYAWSHGISPRKSDLVKTENGTVIQERGTRISFTFRKVREGPCACKYEEYCNRIHKNVSLDDKTAIGLERSYVHKVYEEISSHFNETRHKQWPNVIKFLDTLEKGDLVLDVGCGNGKYLLGNNNGLFKIGCDRSYGLSEICRKRGFEITLSDCLHLPFKDNFFDAAISIAVIHHLSTRERRKRAISEIARVLKISGKCLIYVWAKEQNRDSIESSYIRQNAKKEKNPVEKRITEQGLMFPIHENRTEFSHSDMLVPWKKKDGANFLRYYHVFEENELSKLCKEIPSLSVEDVYYDQGNWCVVLQKILN